MHQLLHFAPSINHLFQLTQHKLPLKMSYPPGNENIPSKITFEDGFPFPVWWDMLVPWRVSKHFHQHCTSTSFPQDVVFSRKNLSFPPPPPFSSTSTGGFSSGGAYHKEPAPARCKSCGCFLGNLHPSCKACPG